MEMEKDITKWNQIKQTLNSGKIIGHKMKSVIEQWDSKTKKRVEIQ